MQNGKLHTRIAQRVGPFTTVEGSAIYVSQSAINHSCAPSTVWKYDTGDATLHVQATQPIAAGAEVTASYIDVTAPAAERKRELLRYYLFNCACERCNADSATPAAAAATGATDPVTDKALAVLAMVEAGQVADSVTAIEEVLGKASIKSLDSRSDEAAAAMANFELVHTDQVAGYSFDQARRVGHIASKLLEAAAQRTGCVPITEALLSKKRAKAFGCKQSRRNGIGSAFVKACENGVQDQVDYFIKNWADAAKGDFAPIALSCAEGPAVAAWQQGLARAILAGHSEVAEIVKTHFGDPGSEMSYLVDDDGTPLNYHDAMCSHNQRRMVHRKLQLQEDGHRDKRAKVTE